jgi:Cytochrome C oxidase subunit II, transmembrane domain
MTNAINGEPSVYAGGLMAKESIFAFAGSKPLAILVAILLSCAPIVASSKGSPERISSHPAALLGSASNTQTSIFSPHSGPAHSISVIAWRTIAITGIIFVVVGGLLAYAIIRFRQRPGDDGSEPPQIFGSTQIELSWTIIPVLIVTVIFLTTARVTFDIQDAPKPKSALDVTVIGHQFWWEIRYPGLGVATANPRGASTYFYQADVGGRDPQLLGAAIGGKNRPIPQSDQRTVDKPRGTRHV